MLTLLLAAAVQSTAVPTPAVATHVSARNVPVEQGARRETIVEGLENPWALAFLPSGEMLVSERPGRLRLIRDNRLVEAPITGLPAVLAAGQGGLLDLALHPRFATNRLLYMTMAQGSAEANRTVVARARLSEDLTSLSDVRILYSVPRPKAGGQHFGSRLAFMPDGSLLVSIGDGGNPPASLDGAPIRTQAQNVAAAFGKVLRLDDQGRPARGNPLTGQRGALPEIFTLGHRNIQGLAWDPVRQLPWVSEHGSLGGDEVNRLVAGANFGWPLVSRTREYAGGAPVGAASGSGMTDPHLLWEVATAPSGLAIYDGNAFPQWRGDLFSGGLASSDVRRVDLDADGRVIGETALRVGARVRDVRVGPDGLLYVLTDEKAGRLLRYSPAPR